MAKTIFKNAFVVSCNTKIGDAPGTDVLVEGTQIKQVGAKLDAAGAEVVDASGMLLMPGMIDTHSHLWETPFKGRVAEGWGMEYFTNIHPLVGHFTPEDVYAAIFAGHIESLVLEHGGIGASGTVDDIGGAAGLADRYLASR